MDRRVGLLISGLLIVSGIIMLSGCIKESFEEWQKQEKILRIIEENRTLERALENITESAILQELDTVVSGEIAATRPVNLDWTQPPESEGEIGIRAYILLKNSSGGYVLSKDIAIPVKIYIYTIKTEKEFDEVDIKTDRSRLVYSSNIVISRTYAEDLVLPASEAEIKIHLKEIETVESDPDIGIIYTEIILPNGRTVEAENLLWIKKK